MDYYFQFWFHITLVFNFFFNLSGKVLLLKASIEWGYDCN